MSALDDPAARASPTEDPAASLVAPTPLLLSSLPPSAASSLLAACCRSAQAPPPPGALAPLLAWMCATPPSQVHACAATVLDALRAASEEASRPAHALQRLHDVVWGLTHPTAAAAMGSAPATDYADVRLSHSVVALGPEHAVGAREAPLSAAAARPQAAAAAAAAAAQAAAPLLPPREGAAWECACSGSSSSSSSRGSDDSSGGGGGGGGAPPPLGHQCPLNTPLATEVTLTNFGRRPATVALRLLQGGAIGDAASATVVPASVVLARGASAKLRLTLHLRRPCLAVGTLLLAEVAGGGPRLCAALTAHAAREVFGVPLGDVPEAAEGEGGGGGGVPLPLARLRQCLLAGAALQEEGVFRVAPSSEQREALRRALNAGALPACSGIAAAHMVKLFLRELPLPLLGALPMGVLMGLREREESLAALAALGERERRLLQWVAQLLADTAAREGANKMSARNLAICVGPNLFAVDDKANPMEALMASQKSVTLLFHLVEQALGQRQASG